MLKYLDGPFSDDLFVQTVVDGIENCGPDLDVVAKFLQNVLSKRDLQQFGNVLCEIIIFGRPFGKHSLLSSGGRIF